MQSGILIWIAYVLLQMQGMSLFRPHYPGYLNFLRVEGSALQHLLFKKPFNCMDLLFLMGVAKTNLLNIARLGAWI
jgi:hypothetical protein